MRIFCITTHSLSKRGAHRCIIVYDSNSQNLCPSSPAGNRHTQPRPAEGKLLFNIHAGKGRKHAVFLLVTCKPLPLPAHSSHRGCADAGRISPGRPQRPMAVYQRHCAAVFYAQRQQPALHPGIHLNKLCALHLPTGGRNCVFHQVACHKAHMHLLLASAAGSATWPETFTPAATAPDK